MDSRMRHDSVSGQLLGAAVNLRVSGDLPHAFLL